MSMNMQIELAGKTTALRGPANPVVDATLIAVRTSNGQIIENQLAAEILLISCPLRSELEGEDPFLLQASARAVAAAMAQRGGGRIIFLLSAVANMAMRRHPRFSIDSAAILAIMRTLAMEFGPKVLVNAVGLGVIEAEQIVSGDEAMLSHTPVGRAGTLDEAVAAVLFFCDPLNSYTTGQILVVDGGWTAGYGRNF